MELSIYAAAGGFAMGLFEVRVYAAGKHGPRVKRGFYLQIEETDISFGIFLAKYGENILCSVNKQRLIARWFNNTKSFPMKLSLTVNNKAKVFNNAIAPEMLKQARRALHHVSGRLGARVQ